MTTKTRDELLLAKTAELESARTIAAKAEAEGRNLSGEERTQIKAHIDEARKSHGAILELDGDAKLLEDLNVLGQPVGELAKAGGVRPGKGKTWGERFTESADVKSWLERIAPTGIIPDSTKGISSPPVAFSAKDILAGGVTDGDGAAGALVNPQWLGLLDGLGQFQRPLTIADLVTRGQTDGDTVSYARVVGFTNNAAPVPEARGASQTGATSPQVTGRKPESSMELEKVTTNVKTLAHWLPATKRALSDAAQIRTLIDEFLRYGLAEELEDQIVSGDGNGENFEGILEVDGIQSIPFETDLLVTTRKAKTAIRVNGRTAPTAYVLNPEDNERFDLMRDGSGGSENSGAFLFGGPASTGVQTLWGLPRLESEAVPVGTGMLANWKMAVLWDREQAALTVSDSHEDFFVRNLVAILAEMRAAFGVIRPLAFAAIDLNSGS
jgi:HK97 family phage major capsid protein